MRPVSYAKIVAAAMFGGLTVAPLSVADQPATPDRTTRAPLASAEPLALPAGVTAKDLKADHAIRSAFGAFEKDALKKNGFSGVIDCLVDQDRQRVKEYKEQKTDALNDVIAKIEGQWKSKYNQDFDISRSERQKAFSGIEIATGQVDNPDLLVGKWPIAQTSMTPEAQTAASKQEIDEAKSKHFGGDVNLEKGRDVAVARVPGVSGLPEVRASLIKEKIAGWRFDIPNNITGQMLHDNLVAQLTAVADHPEQWPSDVDQAYGVVGHRALMALYNVESTPADQTRVK